MLLPCTLPRQKRTGRSLLIFRLEKYAIISLSSPPLFLLGPHTILQKYTNSYQLRCPQLHESKLSMKKYVYEETNRHHCREVGLRKNVKPFFKR